MANPIEQEGLKHIERIEEELTEIKQRTPDSRRAFLNGILQGAGAVLGSIAALAALGWALSFFGVIPGFDQIASYVQGLLQKR